MASVEGEVSYHDQARTILGCQHYARGAKIVAPCCGNVYVCRLCHNDEEMHEIDRHAIQEMICMSCHTRQPISAQCINADCAKPMARYYCGVCKFLDDSPTKSIYHCDPCGICRVRNPPTATFFHCFTCNLCLNEEQRDSHKCMERALESNCPVCSEWMHSSTLPCTRLRCGHFMHESCLNDYVRNSHNYNCPVCSRSILADSQRTSISRSIEAFVRRNRTPRMYRHWISQILCNDCLEKAELPFQITQYHQCPKCNHFNTTVVGSTRPEAPPIDPNAPPSEDEAEEPLMEDDAEFDSDELEEMDGSGEEFETGSSGADSSDSESDDADESESEPEPEPAPQQPEQADRPNEQPQ